MSIVSKDKKTTHKKKKPKKNREKKETADASIAHNGFG